MLSSGRRVLVVGAQSSLTGGATPDGGVVASTDHLRSILHDGGTSIRVQPGLTLASLQDGLRSSGRWFPPVPTHDGAFVGGAVSTDAAGSRTFRRGTTRAWVRGLTVMLPGGDVLELERGEVRADAAGRFLLRRSDGHEVEVQLPMHALPEVPKCSAGYRGGAGLDLIDLFIGAEGTLGAVLEVELATAPRDFAELGLLVGVPDEAAGLAAVGALREIAAVSAIESIDARCTELMRRAGRDAPGEWLLLVQLEVPTGGDAESVAAQLSGEAEGPAAEARAALLRSGAAWEAGLAALPGDEAGSRRLAAFREAAPQAVFGCIASARRESGEDLRKVGGDAIVPFEQLGPFLSAVRSEAALRDLDLAVWGHVSDGNLHPNVIVRSLEDMARGEDFLLGVGRKAIELGGSPLAEHGVGRHPLKQRLLRELVGDDALHAMRTLKRAFDPANHLAPGVLLHP